MLKVIKTNVNKKSTLFILLATNELSNTTVQQFTCQLCPLEEAPQGKCSGVSHAKVTSVPWPSAHAGPQGSDETGSPGNQAGPVCLEVFALQPWAESQAVVSLPPQW